MTVDLPQNDDRKLKILICLTYYFPHRTGLTIHVQRVAEELVRRGHDVTVLTARYSPDLPRDTVMHNGVRVVRLWAPIRISRGMVMPAYPLAAYLFMRQVDVVSLHLPMLESGLLAFVAWLTGVKLIATHHGDLVLPKGVLNRFIEKTVFAMYRFMANRASRLIGYSEDYADHSYYLKPFRDKVSIVYPPIVMPGSQQEKVQALREKWALNGGPIIGYSGRFVQEKRPELAIKALEIINQTYPNTRLVFAGEYDIKYEDTWEREQPLVEQYRDQLIFLGILEDQQDVANFYAACDVLVLPSDTECFALVQVEAMLCGTPVVMTNIPGGRVPVRETGMGLLAKQGNWRSIGEALVKILDDPDSYKKTREEIEAVFSFQDTVDKYEALFQKYARR